MEQKKEDRRVRITKQAIRESLIELMNKQSISKISVKMICEAADINRSTFYAHYKDQYALLQAMQQGVIEDVKRQIMTTNFFNSSDNGYMTLKQVLQYGRENAPLMSVLLGENGDSSFQNELMQLAQEKILEEFSGENTLPGHTVQYLKRFALAGLLSIMRYWLEENCADEPEMLAELTIKLVVHGTKGLFS